MAKTYLENLPFFPGKAAQMELVGTVEFLDNAKGEHAFLLLSMAMYVSSTELDLYVIGVQLQHVHLGQPCWVTCSLDVQSLIRQRRLLGSLCQINIDRDSK